MDRIGMRLLAYAAFATALVASSSLSLGIHFDPLGAVVWITTGIAAAGVWFLGLRAAWIVFVGVVAQRLWADYSTTFALLAGVGSTLEAVLAVVLLRRFGVRGEFATLREVLVVLAIAAVTPLPSIAMSWVARPMPVPGWDGWWRMNVLGLLIVLPSALVWLGPGRGKQSLARLAPCLGTGAATAGLVTLVVLGVTPSTPAILLLTMVLPIALWSALRYGTHGSITTATIGALAITAFAGHDIGPFTSLPEDEQHVTVQILLVALLSVPLVFGALIAEREATTTQWHESEAMRRAMVNALPDLMYKLRADGTFIDAMVPAGTETPVPATQLLGRRIQDLVTPPTGARLLAQLALAHRGLPSLPVEYPIATSTGRLDREIRFVPLPTGDVLGVVRDITARKAAERQLASHARVLEMIASGRPADDVFRFLVEQLEAALPGSSCSILLLRGKHLWPVFTPSVPAGFAKLCEGVEIGTGRGSCGTAAHENRTVVSADIATDPLWHGHADLPMEHGIRAAFSVPVRAPDGTVLGTWAIYRNRRHTPPPGEITLVERAAMLAGLAIDRERREGLLASIQRNIREGLFRCVLGAGLVHANDAFARLLGYANPGALRERLAAGDLGEAAHRATLQLLTEPIETRNQQEVVLHRRDGAAFHALLSTILVTDDQGALVAVDGTVTDITEHKQLEEQLRHAQKMEAVGQLAGGVAHDFNNLLTAISGFADAVLGELPPDSPLCRDVREILKAAERAAGLTRQLLTFGRRQVTMSRIVDLVTTVDQTSDMLRRLIGEHFTLRIHHGQPHTCIRGDRTQLEQVLLNLVLNARDALTRDGHVEIGTAAVDLGADHGAGPDLPPGPYAVLWVRDDGIGMTADVRARAFDPFFTTKEPGKGTGLGLSTVYGIVRQGGGSIRIDSEPNRGTTVWIHLPRVEQGATDEPAVVIPRPTTRPATVLVVEDEPLVRELAQRALRRAGHTVLLAVDGQDGLEVLAVRHAEIDAVVSDVVMPRLGGRELRARMHADWPRIPVLLMSGYANESSDPLDEAAMLHKPFTASGLLDAVERLLASRPVRNSPPVVS